MVPQDVRPRVHVLFACRALLGGLLLLACAACADSAEESSTPAPGSGGDAPAADSGADQDSGAVAENAVTEKGSAVDDPNRVLRHAVFFSFKEESSEEDVQGVVDAFRELPSKIPEIIDFQWGVNNSPEDLDDGFTHCFLLTFKDADGRAVYLPHEAHKAFGDVLRPHMDDVFVIDYWGTPADESIESPLQHAVFFKFKDDAKPEDVEAVENAFAELPSKIDTIKAFEWGTNNSPESHDDDFTHCFLVTFDSEEGRAAYLPHPEHEAFVKILMPVLDKVRVLDFAAAE